MIARLLKLLMLAGLVALPPAVLGDPVTDTGEHGEKEGDHGATETPLVPRLSHVIVVIMENKSYEQTVKAPYTASLIASGALFSASTATHHP